MCADIVRGGSRRSIVLRNLMTCQEKNDTNSITQEGFYQLANPPASLQELVAERIMNLMNKICTLPLDEELGQAGFGNGGHGRQ